MNISSSVSSMASSIFSKLDGKNQGYIDKADLQKAFESIDSSKSGSSASDVEDFFSKFDSDSDGKVTESEFTSSMNNLLSQLSSQMNSARMGMSPHDGKGSLSEDEGLTKEEMTNIAATTDDTNLANMMTQVSSNFEAADANQDGKVTAQEAIAYQRTAESSVSTQAGTSTSDSAFSDSSSSDQQAANALMKIAQLIQAYGFGDASSSTSILTSA